MNVYVVTHTDEKGDTVIDGVFSFEELARLCTKEQKEPGQEIAPFTLDGMGEMTPADAFKAGYAEGLATAQDEREAREIEETLGKP